MPTLIEAHNGGMRFQTARPYSELAAGVPYFLGKPKENGSE